MEHSLDLTYHWAGFTALAIFVFAYALVMAEEFTHLRKSKPVVLAAGLIWGIVAFAYSGTPHYEMVEHEIRHSFLEYAELAFFLLVAMFWINYSFGLSGQLVSKYFYYMAVIFVLSLIHI